GAARLAGLPRAGQRAATAARQRAARGGGSCGGWRGLAMSGAAGCSLRRMKQRIRCTVMPIPAFRTSQAIAAGLLAAPLFFAPPAAAQQYPMSGSTMPDAATQGAPMPDVPPGMAPRTLPGAAAEQAA